MAEIHELPSLAYREITKMMREVADAIDAGEYGRVQGVAAVLMREANEPPEVFSWGALNSLETLGAFALAHHWVLNPR